MEIIAKQNRSSCEGRRMAGEVFRCDERMCERVCVPAMSSVSMRGGGCGGLNILLMSSSGSGGSPLLWRWVFSCCRRWRYWGGKSRRKQVKIGEDGHIFLQRGERRAKKPGDCGRERKGGLERGVLRADRDGVICGGLTVGKSARCRVSGEPKSLVNLEGWSRE